MFYPQLVAGPIERPQHLFPQFFSKHKFSSQHLYEGLRLMAWGFLKKVVVADRLSDYVDIIYKDPAAHSGANIWIAAAFFSIQIYADFSGYSDIASGAAKCMGFELVTNFNRPQLAKNIRDFWKRWHISLSSWFRDYFYIPLGGNRKGTARKNLLILATFTLSGFWHGAGWTFIIWGMMHGLYVLLYDLTCRLFPRINLPKFFGWLLTCFCVGFALIFFRAASIHNAADILIQSLHFKKISLNDLTSVGTYGNFSMLIILIGITYMFVVEKYTDPKLYSLNNKPSIDIFVFVCSVWMIIFFGVFHKTTFIYFQF
jgi:D-alanyl-lipoteichoic acid acyltransferase DltB (MBOAT superfamily)